MFILRNGLFTLGGRELENKGEGIVADSLELHNVWMFQLLNDSCFLYKRFLIQYVITEQFLNDDILRSGRFPTRIRNSLPVSGAVLVSWCTGTRGNSYCFHIHTWSCDAFVNVSFLCVPVHEDTTQLAVNTAPLAPLPMIYLFVKHLKS